MPNPLTTRLEENTARHPAKAAFIFRQPNGTWGRLTYTEFADLCQRFEHGLLALGLPPGAQAVLMAPPGLDFFALTFALVKVGLTPLIIDPAIGFKNVATCLAECQPQIFIGNRLTHTLRWIYGWGRGSLLHRLSLPGILRAARRLPSPAAGAPPDTAAAAIIFTSGSTGLPRGAIYTHDNLLAQVESLQNALDLRGDEIDLPAFPVFALLDLLLGVTAVVPDLSFPQPARVNPRLMLEALRLQQVNTLFASPVVLDRINRYAAQHPTRLDSLKQVITAGAPAPAAVLEAFYKHLPPSAKIFGVYGATEALPICLVDCQQILDETRFASAQGAGVCVGHPAPGMTIKIIPISDEPLPEGQPIQELPAGQVGEIVVSGRAVTQAYTGRPEHTRLAKIRGPQGQLSHRTGDLGYFDPHGRLWYGGRKAHRVASPARLLFSEQVEGIFNAHPEVYRTALVGVFIDKQLEPVLWVELKKGVPTQQQEKIRQELLERAAHFEISQAVRFILFHPAFPTDVRHNSKIIREKLAELAHKRLA
jgi:acyl-CoA synthetase (AMP-forming)/AMP-acid ligase II